MPFAKNFLPFRSFSLDSFEREGEEEEAEEEEVEEEVEVEISVMLLERAPTLVVCKRGWWFEKEVFELR